MKQIRIMVLIVCCALLAVSCVKSQQTTEKVNDKGFVEEEVAVNNGNIKLAGTFSFPKKSGKFPAVLLITGSGAQNRDEDIWGYKPFKMLADYLNSRGIAVLRFDDRGTAKSTGKFVNSTSFDFAKDVEAEYLFMTTHKNVDAKKCGLLGHSEGGLIAPIVCSQLKDKVHFIIMMAGPAVPGSEIISAQIELILKSSGADEKKIQNNLKLQNFAYQRARNEITADSLKFLLKQAARKDVDELPDSLRKFITDPEKYIDGTCSSQIAQIESPWFKTFVTTDPAVYLKQVKCPVLSLFGTLDTQVPEKLNSPALAKIFKESGKTNYEIKTFDKANHLFQEAITGSPQEYSTLKKEFVPGFKEKIADWILKIK